MRDQQATPYDSFRGWTLAELWAEPGIWEPLWDAPNYYPAGTEHEELVQQSRRLLRELYAEGWAVFVRRPWDEQDAVGEELTAEAVEAAIEDDPWHELPLDGTANVWLRPTAKALALREWAAYEAYGKDEGWPRPSVQRVDFPT